MLDELVKFEELREKINGIYLKKIRHFYNLSVEDVARELGMHRTSIQRIEADSQSWVNYVTKLTELLTKVQNKDLK